LQISPDPPCYLLEHNIMIFKILKELRAFIV
jgi:hypothetical protein